jgi:hypothetical protein
MNLSKIKSSHEAQLERIRKLKESYDVALLKADEVVKKSGNNIHMKIQSERAKRVYTAISSLIYSTISFSKLHGLEDYIRQNALTLPATMIDLEEWDYILRVANECRETMVIHSPSKTGNQIDLKKKLELCQYLAIQPLRNTRDELHIMKQNVLDQLNDFFNHMAQSLSAVLYVIEQIKELNRTDANLAKIKALEKKNQSLQQDMIQSKQEQLREIGDIRNSFMMEIDSIEHTLAEEKATAKQIIEAMQMTHDLEKNHLHDKISLLTQELSETKASLLASENHVHDLDQTVTDLTLQLTKEKSFTHELKMTMETAVVRNLAENTAEAIVTQGVNIHTYFEDFPNPAAIKQDLRHHIALQVEHKSLEDTYANLQEQLVNERLAFEQQQAQFKSELIQFQHQYHQLENEFIQQQQFQQENEKIWATERLGFEKTQRLLQEALSEQLQQRTIENDVTQQHTATLAEKIGELKGKVMSAEEKIQVLQVTNQQLEQLKEKAEKEKTEFVTQQLMNEQQRMQALSEHIQLLESQHQELALRLETVNAEKEILIAQVEEKEVERMHALQGNLTALSTELSQVRQSMEDMKTTNYLEATMALDHERDQIENLQQLIIESTTETLELSTILDSLRNEQEKLLILIKLTMLRDPSDERVQQFIEHSTSFTERMMILRNKLTAGQQTTADSNTSETVSKQRMKLQIIEKSLDRLQWELVALRSVIDDSFLPHAPSPSIAGTHIQQLEKQLAESRNEIIQLRQLAEALQDEINTLKVEKAEVKFFFYLF